MSKKIEIVTSVDAYGDYDQGQHVFDENCILVYDNGPDEHVVLKDIKEMKRRASTKYPNWISVADRLPERDGSFLVCCKSIFDTAFNVSCARFYVTPQYGQQWQPDDDYISGRDYTLDKIAVSHWMPLPEGPKE